MIINLKRIATVAMVLRLMSLKTESAGGFEGDRIIDHVVERIRKSRHTIVHIIELKSQVRRFSIFLWDESKFYNRSITLTILLNQCQKYGKGNEMLTMQ